VTAICAHDDFCCIELWDGICVAEVDQFCNCGGGGIP
jgi:hypothetical protein